MHAGAGWGKFRTDARLPTDAYLRVTTTAEPDHLLVRRLLISASYLLAVTAVSTQPPTHACVRAFSARCSLPLVKCLPCLDPCD